MHKEAAWFIVLMIALGAITILSVQILAVLNEIRDGLYSIQATIKRLFKEHDHD